MQWAGRLRRGLADRGSRRQSCCRAEFSFLRPLLPVVPGLDQGECRYQPAGGVQKPVTGLARTAGQFPARDVAAALQAVQGVFHVPLPSKDDAPCRPPPPGSGCFWHVAPRQAPIPLPTMPTASTGRVSKIVSHCGLDHRASMVAPWLLGRPGPPWHSPARLESTERRRQGTAGQNGSSRHVLALLTAAQRRINEQSSGLLIRGFGVRVPGGAHLRSSRFSGVHLHVWV
jgi:hypothetical protein